MRVGIKKVIGIMIVMLLSSALGLGGIYLLCFILDTLIKLFS
jgi:hypothetical protein